MNMWQMSRSAMNWPKIWAGSEIDAAGKRQTSIHPRATLRRPVRNSEGDA